MNLICPECEEIESDAQKKLNKMKKQLDTWNDMNVYGMTTSTEAYQLIEMIKNIVER